MTMGATRKQTMVRTVAVLALGAWVSAAAGQTYRVIELGTLSGRGASEAYALANEPVVSPRGVPNAVGASDAIRNDGTSIDRPFFWSLRTGMIDGIAGIPGEGETRGINSRGDWVGGFRPIRPTPVVIEQAFLGSLYRDAIIFLPTLGGWSASAHDINDRSQVVGWSQDRAGVRRAVRWSLDAAESSPRDLGTLGGRSAEAYAINRAGQVAGQSQRADGRTHAFLWAALDSTGTWRMIDLGVLPGGLTSVGRDVNDRATVVGQSEARSSNSSEAVWRATLFDPVSSNAARPRDLGTLRGDTASDALAINNRRAIVGWSGRSNAHDPAPGTDRRAFLWRDGVMVDLNTLIPAGSGWHLESATDITDTGFICGYGRVRLDNADPPTTARRAFVLVPVGVPLLTTPPAAIQDQP